MAHVIGAAGFLRQAQVALHLPPFALAGNALEAMLPRIFALMDAAAMKQAFIFAVCGNQAACGLHAAHGLAHAAFLLNAASVIRKGHGLRPECLEVAQFSAPALTHRDTPVGMHPYCRIPADRGQFLLQVLRRIRRRI